MKKNYILAIITVLIWSTMAATVKATLSNIPNMQALAVASYISVAFLLIMNIVTGRVKKIRTYKLKDYGTMTGLGFLGMFMYSALYYYGLSQISSQEACIANYLWPIMLVVFSCIILKEKLTFTKAAAMCCSFAGIVILSLGGGTVSQGSSSFGGIISCIIAAMCYGLYSVLNKKTDYDQYIFMMICWAVAAVGSTIFGLATEEWVVIQGTQWIGIIWIGAIVHAVAYLFWALALQGTENTAKIANIAYLTPVLSMIISAVFLKEQLSSTAFIALVLIIGGILIQTVKIKK